MNTDKLNELLNLYARDTENSELNWNLALEYHALGQTAAAITYYLRAAERTADKLLAYECLLKIAACFDSQKNRPSHVIGCYKHALCLLPERPEAYFLLSRFNERNRWYMEAYVAAEQGLNFAKTEYPKLRSNVEYPGRYGLLFEKAVSAWWWGKSSESRKLFIQLKDNHSRELDTLHHNAVQNNLMRLGLTPQTQSISRYDKEYLNDFRFKFENIASVEKNYAQAFQDMFVLCMLNGKFNGTYLEIGSSDPINNNNTYLLEKIFDWTGIGIEIDPKYVPQHKKNRKNNLICENALNVDYASILSEISSAGVVDYLQLDCEPAQVTYDVMLKIPFDDYKFAVITFEHDSYADVGGDYKNKSRRFLKEHGYELLVSDVSMDGVASFEDWWVHPDLVDIDICNKMRDQDGVKKIWDYFMKPDNTKKWYAEFGMDKYIRETYFPEYEYRGTIVEVGAGPPEFISSSKHFRDSGWRSICIDPNPKFVEQHKQMGSEIYQYACSDTEGKCQFTVNMNNDHYYSSENDGVSFSAIDIRYEGVPEHNTQYKIDAEVIKLNTLLTRLSIEKVDVLIIDTEGWEINVLKGFDHIKYAPKVIAIENFENNPTYEIFMNSIGYFKTAELGYNHIYTPKCAPSFSFKSKKRVWIVDDFYDNPDDVRKFALEQEYLEGGFGRGFIGRRTHQQFLFPGLKERFEEIMGTKIQRWEEHGMNGRFQISWAGEPLVYHCDSQRWGGMLYLTPEAPFESGTTLYAHKKTRVRDYHHPRWGEVFPTTEKTHLDKTPFEPVDVLGNVYNRLVIFDASCIHSASEYFGQDKVDGRLWQMFFFD